jgi:hypothetical protein
MCVCVFKHTPRRVLGKYVREERLRVGDPPLRGDRTQRLEIRLGERAHRLHQARVDLGLGQRTLGSGQEPRTKLELVVGEVEVEERRRARVQQVVTRVELCVLADGARQLASADRAWRRL